MYKLDHLTLLGRSLEKSRAFYATLLPLLGFSESKPGIFGNKEGLFIQLLAAKEGTSDYARYAPGLNHMGFCADGPESVQHIRDCMEQAGYQVPPIQILDGATALFIPDPDGLRIEITYYPPGTAVVG